MKSDGHQSLNKENQSIVGSGQLIYKETPSGGGDSKVITYPMGGKDISLRRWADPPGVIGSMAASLVLRDVSSR